MSDIFHAANRSPPFSACFLAVLSFDPQRPALHIIDCRAAETQLEYVGEAVDVGGACRSGAVYGRYGNLSRCIVRLNTSRCKRDVCAFQSKWPPTRVRSMLFMGK